MVEFFIAKTKIKIGFLFVCMLSLLSFLDKSGTIFLSLVFSLFHEMGHIIAIALCKGRIDELSFHPYGIEMKLSKTNTFTTLNEIIVTASGCMVNLLFLLIPNKTVQQINIGIFLFNVLPVGNLDGGRITRLAFTCFFGEGKGERLSLAVSFLTLIPLSAIGFYAVFTLQQPSLLVCSIYLFVTLIIKREKLY